MTSQDIRALLMGEFNIDGATLNRVMTLPHAVLAQITDHLGVHSVCMMPEQDLTGRACVRVRIDTDTARYRLMPDRDFAAYIRGN